eukprot:6193367-Pleurochrysis_carterae.AAC.3
MAGWWTSQIFFEALSRPIGKVAPSICRVLHASCFDVSLTSAFIGYNGWAPASILFKEVPCAKLLLKVRVT